MNLKQKFLYKFAHKCKYDRKVDILIEMIINDIHNNRSSAKVLNGKIIVNSGESIILVPDDIRQYAVLETHQGSHYYKDFKPSIKVLKLVQKLHQELS